MEPKITEKRWDKRLEEPLYKKWEQEKRPIDPHATDVFSIDTPPPYVNSPVHIGHAATYSLMDMFARFHRMKGRQVLFPLGLDRNGLPIEMAAEKRFKKRFNDMSREEYLEMCRRVLEDSSDMTTNTFAKLGISFTSYASGTGLGEVYHTDSITYRTLTQNTFIDLWHKGLIYEDERTNNYCPGCKTTIADSEIDYVEKESLFSDIIWKVDETREEIVIGTTRPELLCSCAMVLYHPDDKRYAHLEGKHVRIPLYDRSVPLMAHPSAHMEKGTGLVMMCSFGDQADIVFFRDMKLDPIISISIDGTMNKNAGFLEGLTVGAARAKILEVLKANNLIATQRVIMHRSPICERSKDHIEFIAMKEWYLKQTHMKEQMLTYAQQLTFHAPSSRQLFIDWINTVSIDWPISRRRYYATEIPLWHCNECKKPYVPPKGKYYQPWKERPPVQSCPHCSCTEFTGETRVFDTWFDSSISPLYILGYERYPEFFARNPQCTLRPQGKEIIRTWLYYTVLKCSLLTDSQVFKDVYIHYHILDGDGRKMSKSLGNGIDPQDVIARFGAEPFRLWCAVEGNIVHTDLRCSFDRIEGAGKTLTKLWNVSRFISLFDRSKGAHTLRPVDTWILHEISVLTAEALQAYARYDFHSPAIALKHFLWETFASHYVELVKTRAYNNDGLFSDMEQKGAIHTLYAVLDTLLKLLAPVIPFITHQIYQSIWEKEIHNESFPEPLPVDKPSFTREDVIDLNSAIWKTKKDKGLSLKSELESFVVPKQLEPLEKDLQVTHNLSTIMWSQ